MSNVDVDLLRTGSVPINPDTVLWFEFLLNPLILEKHLNKLKPDPSPTELIVKFMSVAPDPPPIERPVDLENGETKFDIKRSKKSLALKILSLKIAAFLKWDLDLLEAKLPLPMQVTLLQDLLLICQGKEISVNTHDQIDIDRIPAQELFAILLYHRWVLRAAVGTRLVIKQPRQTYVAIPALQDPLYVPQQLLEEMLVGLEGQVPESLTLLNKVTTATPSLKLIVPTYQTFSALCEDSLDMDHQWEGGEVSYIEEIQCQIHFDLGAFYFAREQYERAKEHMTEVVKLNPKIPKPSYFCVVNENKLQGFCTALGITLGQEKPTLLVQFLNCPSNQYVNILQQDNVSREIPLVHRDALELDIQAASASGRYFVSRDLLMQIKILNSVRRAVEGTPTTGDLVPCLLQRSNKGLDLLISALVNVFATADNLIKERLHFFILDLVEAGVPNLASKVINSSKLLTVMSEDQVEYLKTKSKPISPKLEPTWCENIPKIKAPELQLGLLKESLLQTHDPDEIIIIVQKMYSLAPNKPLWKSNTKWELPIALQNVVLGLKAGVFQNTIFTMFVKAKEQLQIENYEAAKNLLQAVETQVQKASPQLSSTVSFKLARLASWESLLVLIIQFFAEWPIQTSNSEIPASFFLERADLGKQCKGCLTTFLSGDAVTPRIELVEHCALALLNLGEWEFLVTNDRRWNYIELPISIAYACQDIAKHKGNKKVSRREAWDLILPVFGSNQPKRGTSGSSRDSPGMPTLKGRAQLLTALSRLREPTAIAVAVSLLARLYNVLKDEPNLELNVEYVGLWPAVVSNANSFSSRSVGEVLSQLVQQALKYYPGNISWLKVLGDISFANSYYSSAIKNYLEACIAVSGYFSQPMPRGVIDDQVYLRMIKCCTQLQCHTQAAVLCQFLNEVDYATAFKSLQEKNSADAMDAYYSCIWDTSILEFLVHLHAKRGEQDRRQQANKYLGLLELNSNNNEEIRRESANLRKSKFLRAMARHYVC